VDVCVKTLLDATLVKIRKWLAAPDPSVNFQKALKLREPHTGQWLLESDLYREWKENASFIWLHGIPGCGKTILSSTLLENILGDATSDPGKAVAYFYFDFNDRRKQDPELMVRSLISQLSQQCIRISSSLDELYSAYGNGQSQPSLDALLKVLQNLIKDSPRTYVIIDALDECNNCRELMNVIKDISTWHLLGLHVIFTSRRVGDIDSTLGYILDDKNILCIQTEAVNHDIRLFVRQRLSNEPSLRKWQTDSTLKQQIETSLMEKAHGMYTSTHYPHIIYYANETRFRWAACQLDVLGECRNRKQLFQALADLPPNLDETYDRILYTIKKSDIPYAIRILRWLAFSSRPLVLAEVAEVAAINPDRDTLFDRDEILTDPLEVINICSSLVCLNASDKPEINWMCDGPGGDKVVLAHYSVKEYLVSKRILESEARLYCMESALCHRFIAKCCVRYLLQFDTSEALTRANLHEFALARYAAKHWTDHVKLITKQEGEIFDLIMELLRSGGNSYLTCARLYSPESMDVTVDFSQSISKISSPLCYMSRVGLAEVVRRLVLETDADVNAQGGMYYNALQAASAGGYLGIAQFLIEKGAYVNAKGGLYGNALQAALSNGCLDVAYFLVEKGANVNAQGGMKGNALQAASSGGYLGIVQLLIEKGANVNAEGGLYSNALQAASFNGRIDVVYFLVERGADINAQGEEGSYGSSVSAASYGGHLGVVQFLVEKGADINTENGRYGNPLQAASTRGHLDVVQFLVEQGADVNAQGRKERSGNAVQAASFHGHLDIVEFLVEKGADINVTCRGYGNALQAAVSTRYLDVAQFLLDKGADVNAQGGVYGNALQEASYYGNLETIQFLVERGANVNAESGIEGNAIQIASSNGHLAVTQFLIEKGADVNAQAKEGKLGNAVRAASLYGHLDIVKFLVEKGADINLTCKGSGNALHAAVSTGFLDVAQFLVEKGADVNARGGIYGNALQEASRYGNLGIIQFLVEKGAEVNAHGGIYGNALQAASSSGHLEVVRFLKEKGAGKTQ
jgi:ankyrin repeat protein